MVHGQPYTAHYPLDTPLPELRTALRDLRQRALTDTPKVERGTLQADVSRYLALVRQQASHRIKRAHLDAWLALGLGVTRRHRITAHDVLEARNAWLEQGASPKTINHRVNTLRHLYHLLDGVKAPTPCDDVAPLAVPRTVIRRIPDDLIVKVDQALQRREDDPRVPLWTAKTRARFRVLVSTGRRPCEIMRARPEDVDLSARVWVPRDAKGGFTPGLYLNEEQVAAWQLFFAAAAWGPYNTSAFADTIRAAGWPAGVRPYQARHNYGIKLSEAGVDLADVSTALGHTSTAITRRVYVPVLQSRMQKLAEAVAGRFGGWEPKRETKGKSTPPEIRRKSSTSVHGSPRPEPPRNRRNP